MVIIEVIVPCYGLQSQAKGRMIQASQGIAKATGVLQPELGLATIWEASPSHLPPVKEVLYLSFVCAVSLNFHPLQDFISPKEMTSYVTAAYTIPATLVPAPDPQYHLH